MSDPRPHIAEQYGTCSDCKGRYKLSAIIDHLVDVHGHEVEDLEIEVSDRPTG